MSNPTLTDADVAKLREIVARHGKCSTLFCTAERPEVETPLQTRERVTECELLDVPIRAHPALPALLEAWGGLSELRGLYAAWKNVAAAHDTGLEPDVTAVTVFHAVDDLERAEDRILGGTDER